MSAAVADSEVLGGSGVVEGDALGAGVVEGDALGVGGGATAAW